MTEPNETPKQEPLAPDFQQLGENLAEMLRAAWDRPERKNLQREIENGLNEVGAALNQAASEFSVSDTGQKIKTGVEDVKSCVDGGEIESNIRAEVRGALRTMNSELQKLITKLRDTGEQE